MGRQSYWSRSTRGAEREFPGCMSGVLHLFDFNQAASSRKLLQETRFCEGLEAPRNSLDVPTSGIMDLGRKSESNVNDIPFGFELPKKEFAKSKLEDTPRKSLKDSPMENEHKRRMPNVVARLMGLELMPDETVSSDHSRRNSVSGRQFLSIFIDKQHKQEQQASKVQSVKISQNANRSQIFREHPQEKQLEAFKREFEAYEIQQHRDYSPYLKSEKHNNVTSAARRHHNQKLSREENTRPENTRQSSQEESRKLLEALEFLHKNKENFVSVLEDGHSLQRKFAEPKERTSSRCAEATKVPNRSVFRCRSKPPLVDEVAPFRASRNDKRAKILSPNNNTRNLSSSLTPKITLPKPPSEAARVPKPSYSGSLLHQCSKNESRQSNNSNKTLRLPKDVINPREIVTEIVKHAKENATAKASKEKITASQDFGCSSTSRRRNLRKEESISLVEADSPSTLKRLSNHSEKCSPRMVNSPRRIDHDFLKHPNSSQSKPNSPRLGDSSPRSKFKSDDRSSMDRAKGGQDFSVDSPRMLSRSHSLPTAHRYLHARPSSSSSHCTNQKIVSEDYSVLKAKSASIPVIKRKNKSSTKECLRHSESANLVTCDVEVRSEVVSDTPACPRHSQTERLEYANVFDYLPISLPNCGELASVCRRDEDQTPHLVSEEFSSADKTSDRPPKWPRGEVRYSISDGKCEYLSPVSVLGGLFQGESLSPVDIKETSPDGPDLRDKRFTIKLNRDNLPESKQEGKVSNQPKFIARDKVSNSTLNRCLLQTGGLESLSVDHIVCPDESKSDLLYVRDILCFAGFRSHRVVAFTAWYSPAHPVNPDIFHQLEKYYSSIQRTTRNPSQSQRRLLFELVDEILCKKVKPFLNIRPWVNPKKLNRCYKSTGKQLLEELWSEICSFAQADYKIAEDVNALLIRDFAIIEECQMASHEDVEKIGFEIEQQIFNSLIEEAIADFVFAV